MGNKVYSQAVGMLSAPSFITVTAYLKKRNTLHVQFLLMNQKQTHISSYLTPQLIIDNYLLTILPVQGLYRFVMT